jgi:CheY-like chemotaxis protein
MSDTIATAPGMDTPQTRNRLLLVDGDPKSLRVLDVSLKKAGFEVATASSGREALASLAAELPDLIISDTDLDEMDGFELCNRIKAKPDWAKIPFLFVSGRKSIEDKIRGLELGVDDYLTKPIYIKEIGIRVRTALQRAERERMESRREGRTRFAGDLSDVGVVDLVQTIELNRKSGIVHVVNRDERRGSIFFRDGKVIDAEVGRLSGAHALYRLFSWSDGQFAVEFKHIRRHDRIEQSMAALLMEGMRRLDEATRLLEKLPGTKSVLEVDCRVLAEELAELPDEMNSVLRLCDGARTLQEVVEDSDLPDLETLGIIDRLFADQIIFARQPPERGGEAEPGARLATWLSEGGAERAPAVDEVRLAPERPLVGDPTSTAQELPPPVEPATADSHIGLSAEETLGAALPSYADSALAEGYASDKAASTLKGVPVEGLFPEPARRLAVEPRLAESEAQRGTQSSEEQRPTKPMGLAERLLSGDSVVRASAMHEAMTDEGDGRVTEPLAVDRHTQPYGAAEAAAALVQEVVSQSHGKPSQVVPPSEPERPRKEVDWGAWPALAPAGPTAAPPVPTLPPAPPPHDAPPAQGPPDSRTSGAELEASDLEEVEPSQPPVVEAISPPSPLSSAPPVGEEEGGTRLDPEDVLPMEAPEAEGSETRAATTSFEETTAVRDFTAERRRQARQFWLMVFGAFLFGMAAVLLVVVARRVPQVGRPAGPAPQAVSVAGPPAAPSPSASPPALPLPAMVTHAPAEPKPAPLASSTTTASETKTGTGPGSSAALAATGAAAKAEPAAEATAETPSAAELRRKCIEVDADGRGRARAVAAACRPALDADPQDASLMVILARAEIDRGRLGEARALARRALAADPTRAEAYVYLGTAEQEAGKVEEARAAYKKYVELAPDGRFAREIRAILNNL